MNNLDEMTSRELGRLFPVILQEHDPAWKARYLAEKLLLEQAAGVRNLIRMNHIGSTVVPGLIAKPTIDILLEIRKDADVGSLKANIRSAGYRYIEQPDNPPPHMMFVKGYTPQGFSGQAFHVHVRYGGDWDELYFRDYLLAHPETSEEYGELKKKLQEKYEHDRDGYTDAKTPFIKRITGLARLEIQQK